MFGCRWERVRMSMTPARLRAVLFIGGLISMALTGAANERWE